MAANRFVQVSEDDVKNAKILGQNPNTAKNTLSHIRTWREWATKMGRPQELEKLNEEQINDELERFILGVRKPKSVVIVRSLNDLK